MTELGRLLGSNTRGNVVEALAMSEEPLTSYRIAKQYNMNISKVYLETRALADLGMVEVAGRRRGTEYRLSDPDLKKLALKFAKRVSTIDDWKGRRALGFRNALRRTPAFSLPRPKVVGLAKETRLAGELDTLALMGRRRFDSKYRLRGERLYARL